MKRLFFALWPDSHTRQQCSQLQKQLQGLALQPVLPGNLHVTLVFLGSIDQSQEQAIIAAAANIPVSSIEIVFDRLSFWKTPQILCLTGHINTPAVLTMITGLNQAAREQGIAVDDRPYQAHVTLARKARQPVPLDFQPIVWRSNSFCLVESCSLPTGVEYRVLHRWQSARLTPSTF